MKYKKKTIIHCGSTNVVKIKSVERSFNYYYENVSVLPHKTDSNVSNQPIGDATFSGAENRAESLFKKKNKSLEGDFFIGIEGGIINLYKNWFAFGVSCLIDFNGTKSFGTSALFPLPDSIALRLINGEELGDVIDDISNSKNSKHNEGAIGFLSKGIIKRDELYVPAVISSLIPFLNKNLF